MTKVYTKTGDSGTTSLVGGTRISKEDPRIEAYGTVDELTAQTAYLRDNMYEQLNLGNYAEDLLDVLDQLMRVSALLAAEEATTKMLPPITDEHLTFLESRIDTMSASLAPVDRFTIPGGHPLVSLCHICRTVCRRSERRILSSNNLHPVDDAVKRYINRLSDYFYILGRKLSDEFNVKEIYWTPNK